MIRERVEVGREERKEKMGGTNLGAVRFALVSSLPACLLFVALCAYYFPFLEDDAYISMRYAARFSAGRGLTFNDGEYVEGYTNFLWVILTSALGFVMSLESAVRVLGITSGLACFFVVSYWSRRMVCAPLVTAAGNMFLAACFSLAIWAVGGLEGNLLVLAFVGSLVSMSPFMAFSNRSGVLLLRGLPGAVLVLVRADAILLLLALLTALMVGVRSRREVRWIFFLAIPGFLTFCCHEVFRITYYGDWLPNTAWVREPGVHSWGRGARYVLSFFKWSFPLWLMVAIGALSAFRKRGRLREIFVLLVSVAALWTCYVVAIGGGIFPGYRHMLPVVGCGALLLPLALKELVAVRLPLPIRLSIGTILFVGFFVLQARAPKNQKNYYFRWQESGVAFGKMVRVAFAHQSPLIAVEPAGAIPFYSGFPTLDLYGLTDRHIAKGPRIVSGAPAHEKGDPHYVMQKNPDLIVFGSGEGGRARSWPAHLLEKSEGFSTAYVFQCFAISGKAGLKNFSYLRSAGRLGAETRASEIVVPVWAFVGPGACVHFDSAGQPSLHVPAYAEVRAQVPTAVRAKEWRLAGDAGSSLQVIHQPGTDDLSITAGSQGLVMRRVVGSF